MVLWSFFHCLPPSLSHYGSCICTSVKNHLRLKRRSCMLAEAPWAIRQSRSISPNLIPPNLFLSITGWRVSGCTGPVFRNLTLSSAMWLSAGRNLGLWIWVNACDGSNSSTLPSVSKVGFSELHSRVSPPLIVLVLRWIKRRLHKQLTERLKHDLTPVLNEEVVGVELMTYESILFKERRSSFPTKPLEKRLSYIYRIDRSP